MPAVSAHLLKMLIARLPGREEKVMRIFPGIVLLAISFPAVAEELCPKYGECVPKAAFDCRDITRSSLVTRVCYNAEHSYLIVRLKQTNYHYCEIDQTRVADFLAAASMGLSTIGRSKTTPPAVSFSCRDHVESHLFEN